MKEQDIQNIFRFLSRVDLKGNEVPVFNQCVNFLQGLMKEETEAEENQEE